jgi:dienelactone hydrolase
MKFFLLAVALTIPLHITFAEELSRDRQAILELSHLAAPPLVVASDRLSRSSNIHSLFFDALPYEGKATKTFAWLGMPEKKERHDKVPGIILVHGGGGTAFKEWVERWNDQGFAAMSIAVEGQTDEKDANAEHGCIPTGWKQHTHSGPYRIGIYGDSDKPLKDQWMYHAVADTILAHSLLRSHPRVDPENVGVMGISWGGVIVSTAVGIDTRFAFGIPTYGCGSLADAANQYGKALGNNTMYRETWDPMHYLSRATMPLLWQSWPEDKHFPLDCQALSYKRSPGPRLVSLRPGMGHGHGPPWTHADSYAFARSIVKTGNPWCAQKDVAVKNGTARASFSSSKPFGKCCACVHI